MASYPVKLLVYDVSMGMARQISTVLLGQYLEGVWHTAICVYGNEYFFGGDGISYCPPGGTVLGAPHEVVDLGPTEIDPDTFMEYLISLSETAFRPESYHVIDHNCNSFSEEIGIFLTGNKIPDKITNMTHQIMNSQFGQMIRPFIESLQGPIQTGVHIGRTANSGGFKPESTASTQENKSKPSSSTQQSSNHPNATAGSSSTKQASSKPDAKDDDLIDLD